jgi:DNA-binding transcriptional LysR family regulator
MDLKQLRYFKTIVEEGSITAAARKLFMSQPPLSCQIKLLEEEFGCTLFERGSRSVHLTEAGQTLYNYALSILDLSDAARQDTISTAKKHSGIIRIGIVSSIICSTALEWIREFSENYPDIRFEIIEGNSYDLINRFETNSIHLALLRTPLNQSGLTCLKLFTDSLVVIGHKTHFKSTSTSITLSELSKLPLVVYRRWHDILRKCFEAEQLEMNCFCLNDDARTTFSFVDAGLGVGLVPQSVLSLFHNPDIIHKTLCGCTIASDVVLAYNADHYLPECSKDFIHFISKKL